MFDLGLDKLLVIGVLALFLVGPDKLPLYAAQLAKWIRVARSMADDAKHRVAAEMGPEFEDVDWASLDPRRYHPKRLLQEAWNAPAESATDITPPEPSRSDADDDTDLLLLAETHAQRSEPARNEQAVFAIDG